MTFSILVDASDVAIGVGIDSRYISEGRDNTDKTALKYMEVTTDDVAGFSLGLWHGRSNFEDYHETNLSVSREWGLTKWASVGLDYTYLDFSGDEPSDHEVSLSWVVEITTSLALDVTSTYSEESEGVYSTVGIAYITGIKNFEFSPYASIGINNDYVADEHNGADHYAVGVELSYSLEEFSVGGHISAVAPIDEEPGDTLVESTWLGLNVSYNF
ncbi:hypothetical protein FKG94_10025 [Exilibacterium tricleocarpae]|uniref:Porin n=2 Tax=Exilibacterium tricleocarpae TaxID=2591008 RepID=A0A545TUY1_9GAMM|nr:hypothetical protein FKG94_10025 [Exilibacterium tricleocarpae]